MRWINTLLKLGFDWNMKRIDRFMEHPFSTQQQLLQQLITKGQTTTYGKKYGLATVRNYEDFRQKVPLTRYEDLKPYIQSMMQGQANVLWPGKVKWFSRSSGTTSDKSKYIPVTDVNLRSCHLQSGHDVMSMWFRTNPNSKLFVNSKSIIMGGELSPYSKQHQTFVGDVSAILIQNMPFYAKYFITPDVETALMKDWEAKIERVAKVAMDQNITTISGVPTWTLLLFKRILELRGEKELTAVFPNFELYMHGGVDFAPYRSQFQALFGKKIAFRNTYNASEGFFAGQLSEEAEGMLLFLNNGVFYEFIPLSELSKPHPKAYAIDEVQLDQDYALVITTNAGLWRYIIGDTVRFTSLRPHQIQITGRTKQFINVFGEEVMVWNTDNAIAQTCASLGGCVAEYTVAPKFLSQKEKGGHLWVIEFEKTPENLEKFQKQLDQKLQELNSDYAAKRYKNMALQPLQIETVPKGTFHAWLKSKGKFGRQHKVPRLSNQPTIINEILTLHQTNETK